jgi:hypothetical protein
LLTEYAQTPFFSAAARIAAYASGSRVSGFSQRTWSPDFRPSTAGPAWNAGGVATISASRPFSFDRRSLWFAWTRAAGRSLAAAARRASVAAAISTPSPRRAGR